MNFEKRTLFDIVMFDDGEYEGYDLINPEGEHYYKYRVASQWSPGFNKLLQGAEELIETVTARRAVLEMEVRNFYGRH